MQSACDVLCWHLWSVRMHHIFPRYFINIALFEKKVTEHYTSVLSFSTNWIWNISHSKKKRDIVINVKNPPCKVPVTLIIFKWNLTFVDIFSKKSQIQNFIQILPVEAEFSMQTDGLKERHEYDNSRFSQFGKRAKKILRSTKHSVFVCFVYMRGQTAIISLFSISWFDFYNQDGECLLRGRS
jgi:hypothetical protein